MSKYVGTVKGIYIRDFSGKQSVSFTIEGSPLYFRTGENRFPGIVEKGNSVEFEATENPDGKSAKVVGAVVAGKNAPKVISEESVAEKQGKSGGVDWAKKDASIQYQSSRKDGLEFINLLISSGSLKLPADVAKRVAVLEAALDRYTAQFYADIADLGAVKRTTTEDAPPGTPEGETGEEE